MSFYLLKGTYKTTEAGMLLLDTAEIEAFGVAVKDLEDRDRPVYVLNVFLKSEKNFRATFNSMNEVKKAIEEMIGKNPHIEGLEPLPY